MTVRGICTDQPQQTVPQRGMRYPDRSTIPDQRRPRGCRPDPAPKSSFILLGIVLIRRAAQQADDPPRQSFLDLAMSWNCLRCSGHRISIPVVLASVSNQVAAEALDRLKATGWCHSTRE